MAGLSVIGTVCLGAMAVGSCCNQCFTKDLSDRNNYVVSFYEMEGWHFIELAIIFKDYDSE